MFRHADELFALISGGFFFTTFVFATLWVRARERAARALVDASVRNLRRRLS